MFQTTRKITSAEQKGDPQISAQLQTHNEAAPYDNQVGIREHFSQNIPDYEVMLYYEQ